MMKQIKRQIHAIRRRISPHAPMRESFRRALETLGPGKVAIDCGANVGGYTVKLARTGAHVHAFEPNPHAFGELRDRVMPFPNVHLYKEAVSSHNGSAKLFFHNKAHEDPEYHSTSASLENAKSNIDADFYVEVDLIDFADFIERVGQVALLKMDIEGHEVDVLNHLMDRDLFGKIDLAFVELHDCGHPALKAPTDKLRARMAKSGSHFDLTWH